jgi:DNA modification methylase
MMLRGAELGTEITQILEDCDRLALGVRIEDRTTQFAKLLTFDANLTQPIHRWFRFKEGFSQQLVAQLLIEFPPPSQRTVSLLDPFAGVGTSLLAAASTLDLIGIKSIKLRGIEVNPYIHFVAQTKLDWQRYDAVCFQRAAARATNGLRLPVAPEIPTLSTIANEQYIHRSDLMRMLELRDKVRVIAQGRPELRPLLLGIAAGAERIFNLRKDGRALRYVPREGSPNVDEEIERSWSEIAEDLQLNLPVTRADWRIVKGDGRRADHIFSNCFDYILFSPPYLNNIDYTEVYKIEQWLLGFLVTADQMVAQRRRTFRSHPSCLFPDYPDAELDNTNEILGSSFKRLLRYAGAHEPWRARLFSGYFADMLRTLRACHRRLKRGGRVFIIVGNSTHGSPERPIPVATDLWTAQLARHANLRLESILIGRFLPRRRTRWEAYRESIVVLSKR